MNDRIHVDLQQFKPFPFDDGVAHDFVEAKTREAVADDALQPVAGVGGGPQGSTADELGTMCS